MRLLNRVVVCLALTVGLGAPVLAATITGNVKGPDGMPFMGAFVVAENAKNKMTVNVLSDSQGRYHINNLPAATYTVQISVIGYTSAPRTDVQLTAGQNVSIDFALQKSAVRWSDLNTYQGIQLLPKTKSHDLSKAYQDTFFTGCLISCHSFQKRMASTTRNEEGLRAAVKYMR